jgi:hypothetical protein
MKTSANIHIRNRAVYFEIIGNRDWPGDSFPPSQYSYLACARREFSWRWP